MKTRSFLLSVFLLSLLLGGDLKAQDQLQIYGFEDLPRLQSQQQRPVFVFLTADWCRYCKNVETTSFEDSKIIELLNKNFYSVLFDIESKLEIKLYGRTFKYKSTGTNTGVHQLAELLGTVDGVMNTPTFVLLDPTLRIQYQYGGYMDTKEILTLLQLAE